jgi:hypothetical protein
VLLAGGRIRGAQHVAVLTETAGRDDQRVGSRSVATSHDTVVKEPLDAVAERDVDRAGAYRALEFLRDLGTATDSISMSCHIAAPAANPLIS